MHEHPAFWLAKQNLTGEQFKVLFYLFWKLDFDNYIRVSHQEIADWIHINRTNVSRSIKALKELGIILEGPAAGKFKTYRLSPKIAYGGTDPSNTIEFDKFKKQKKNNDDIDDNSEKA